MPVDGEGAMMRENHSQEMAFSHYLYESAALLTNDRHDEQSSLKMLSVAVESLEDMDRQSKKVSKNYSNNDGSPDSQRLIHEDYSEDVSLKVEKDCANNVPMTKSTGESQDNDSSVIDDPSTPSEEYQGREHDLNMLCELAVVQQQGLQPPRILKQVDSCTTSLADNDTGCEEARRLSFEASLRKQTVSSGAFMDLSTDAMHKEHLKQNEDLVGCELVKDGKLLTPLNALLSKEIALVTLESDRKSNGTSSREGDNSSTSHVIDDSKSGEIKFVEKDEGLSREDTEDIEKSFAIGDLVWAKVKSHPWWPGQIFDASDASPAAKKIQKSGRILVAFFGDGTFGWLEQSQLIPFATSFSGKVKQTTMKSFCRAVAEALDEVTRRMEFGLKCSHSVGALYRPNAFPGLNAGIRNGVRLLSHEDIESSKGLFQPERVLTFVRTTACSPSYPLSAGLECSKLCGHFYSFRSFMLYLNRTESNSTLLNMSKAKAQKNGKLMQGSVSKRKVRVDESAQDFCSANGKDIKRLHISKHVGDEVIAFGSKILFSKVRSDKTFPLAETEKSKASKYESKFCESVHGNSWLEKGKCHPDSLYGKQKKKVRDRQSLGSPRIAQRVSSETEGCASLNSDDDNRTLFDITGYHSLKKKKKIACESATNVPIKDTDQKLQVTNQEFSQKQGSPNSDEVREGNMDFPVFGMSSLRMGVSQPYPHSLLLKEDYSGSEQGSKERMNRAISKYGDRQDEDADVSFEDTPVLKHVLNFRQDKGDQFDPKDDIDLVSGNIKGKSVDDGIKEALDAAGRNEGAQEDLDLNYACVLNNEQLRKSLGLNVDGGGNTNELEGKLLGLQVCNAVEHLKGEVRLTTEYQGESKKVNEMVVTSIVDKTDVQYVDASDVDQGEKKGELGVSSTLRGQAKRSHPDPLGNIPRSSVKKQKRVRDMQNKSKLVLSSALKDERCKASDMCKVGTGVRTVAGTLIGVTMNLKSANSVTSKDDLSAGTSRCKVEKGTKKLNADHCLLKKQVTYAQNGVKNEDIFLRKFLSRLRSMAIDPLSSANMRKCLGGAMTALLKFRNMVFVKSSGYAAGKVVPSIMDGLSTHNKVSKQACCGKISDTFGMHQMGAQNSCVKAKAFSKAKCSSKSISGPRLRKSVESDFSGKAKAIAANECLSQIAIALGHESHVTEIVSNNEAASFDMAIHGPVTNMCSARSCVQGLAAAARKRKLEVISRSASKALRLNEELKGSSEKLSKERISEINYSGKRETHRVSKSEGLLLLEQRSLMKSSAGAKVALGLFMQFPEDYTLPTETELREIFSRFGSLEVFGIRVYKNASTAQVVFKHRDDAEAAWQYARKNRVFGQANVSYRLRHFSLSSKDGRSPPAQSLRKSLLAKHGSSVSQKDSLPSLRFSTKESSFDSGHKDNRCLQSQEQSFTAGAMVQRCEPVPERFSARDSMISNTGPVGFIVVEQAPIPVISSKSEKVLAHSPVWESLEGKTVSGAVRSAESASVQTGPISDPARGNASASRLQLTLPASTCLKISLASEPDQGGLVGPSIMHQLEAIQTCCPQDVTMTNSVNPSLVSSINLSSGDIQDQMLKLLEQVSVIVGSNSFTQKST